MSVCVFVEYSDLEVRHAMNCSLGILVFSADAKFLHGLFCSFVGLHSEDYVRWWAEEGPM